MAQKRKYGFSWSWKRASGLSGMRSSIAHKTGIPTTKLGMQRKVGAGVIDLILKLIGIK